MKTVRQKGFAKINLYLDVTGVNGGFHMLDSVVTTVSLYDEVILTSRKDDKIVLKTQGSLFSVTESFDNNVYKAAEAFVRKFGTCGADITLHKFVPVSSGMGGSSADIAATLIGMKRLYNLENADLKELADALGSDSGYLLTGGYARLTGRGEIIEKLDVDKKLYFVVACAKGGVNTGLCFKKFDELPEPEGMPTADEFVEKLKAGTLEQKDFYNALYLPAAEINPKVKEIYEAMKDLSPVGCAMTGSGSGVFGIYDSIELCEWAAAKLKKVTKDVFVCESIDPMKPEKRGIFGKSIYSIE